MSSPEWLNQDPEVFRAKVKLVEDAIAAHPPSEQEKLREEMMKNMDREQAVAYGRALGEDEAERRNEAKEWADSRIRRAMMYAAWEFDGKPLGRGADYRKEFGIPEPQINVPGVVSGSDFVERKR